VDSNNNKISSYTSYIKFQEQEKKLVKLLSQYLFQTNQTLNILGGNKYLYDEEYKYFKDILKENKNWNFIKPEKRHYSFPYRCVNSAEIILGIDSSLLYESIALGKKTIFFNCRVLDKYLDENRHFGWPKKFDDEGFFWTKNLSLDSISSKINSIDKLSKNEWNDGIKDYKSHLLNYDKSNKTFNDTVSKIF
jgi:surface carbohydrate biosynthesis protein